MKPLSFDSDKEVNKMENIKRIIVPTDFSTCADRALGFALTLAEHFKAQIYYLHVVSLYEPEMYGEVSETPESLALQKKMEQYVEERLQASADKYQTENVKIVPETKRSFAVAPAIQQYADEVGADLIVIGTHGRRGIKHLLLGSVAETLVRKAKSHVITVCAEKAKVSLPNTIHRVLVPVDFSGYARPTLQAAYRFARSYSADLLVLHMIESAPLPFFWMGLGTIHDVVTDLSKKAIEHLDRLIKNIFPSPEIYISLHIEEGYVASGIETFAQEHDVDLIIMARHGLSGTERFLIGSVTERVVRSASSPVFTLHGIEKDDNLSKEMVSDENTPPGVFF